MGSTEIIVLCAFLGLCLAAAAIALMEGILFHWKQEPEKEKSFTMRDDPHGKYLTPIAPFTIEPPPTRTLYVAGGIDLPEIEGVDAGEFVIQSADVVAGKVCVVAQSESGHGVVVYFPAAAFEGVEMCELIGCVLTYSIRLEPGHN